MGWGQGAPLGRMLDAAGSEEKLVSLMNKAVEAARKDKDPRSLKHILQAKDLFERTWLRARKEYLKNFRELTIYKRTSPIKIDGNLDEIDWKNADTLANFKPGGHTKKTASSKAALIHFIFSTNFQLKAQSTADLLESTLSNRF